MARNQPLAWIAKCTAVALAYFATARLGLSMHAVSGVATAVWPPTGISLAALVLLGEDLWPAVMVGAFAANIVSAPLLSAATFAAGNTLEAVLGAELLRRLGFRPSLGRLRDAVILIGAGALLSTTVSASFGVLGLKVGGVSSDSALVWRVWWVGDAMGDLLVAPLLLVWASRRRSAWPPWRLAEGSALLLAQVGIALLVDWRGSQLPTYLLFPLLVLAVLRFGQPAAVIGAALTATISIASTWYGHGPFIQPDPTDSLVRLEGFLGILSITLLILGAVVEERRLALRAREQVLAIVSHDLGNLLANIQIRAEHMERKLQARSTEPDVQRDVVALIRSSRRMQRLIRDLVDVSSIQAGRLRLEAQPCDPARLLEDAAQAEQPRRAIELIAQSVFPTGVPSITGDRDRLLQVFSNLIGNATRVMPGGGRIVLRSEERGPEILFSVSDSGPGIPERDLPYIFEPYRRGLNVKYEGLGLGLAISKAIVESHGGRIWVDSSPDKGATFFFTVPRAARPDATVGAAVEARGLATQE